ncbi:nudC domain-containing protein 3 [Zerene cesonia]|uniref:nudC domain-containing protein 3 n=1 Tax=Zerene cesonia TaxID=33412 RepID=UPI0018E4E275|nr:nudC domain-containing protein 3 [Zerene cesonia]
MTDTQEHTYGKYDQVLSSILEEEKSILGFLSSIFGFLARRTDFYYVPKGPYENMGFPPGVAEELVIKVLRKCDPKTWYTNEELEQSDMHNEIMCSTVAREVEIVDENETNESVDAPQSSSEDQAQRSTASAENKEKSLFPEDYQPPVIPAQNSESYNGAVRDTYTWSQTIMDLDVIVNLPSTVKSSKDLKVTINSSDLTIVSRPNDIIIKDAFPYKIKAIDSFWSISEGRLLLHLEKVQERWWDRLLESEEPINLDKIDCSRPLNELPEDHIEKVRELQWNQEQKMKGLPTSDEIRNIQMLKKAWNSPGSPFIGQEFDPSVLSNNI